MTDTLNFSSASRRFAAAAGVLTGAALLLQLWLTMGIVLEQGRGFGMGLVVYFGFFTVLTNLLAAWCLTAVAAGPRMVGHRSLTNPITLTTVAAAITVVGLVYFLILRHTWKPEGAQFVADAALHYVSPVLTVVFWFWAVPSGAVKWRQWHGLFAYPAVYLIYVFIRGEIFQIYPYFFIDVGQIGYTAALRNAAGVLVAYGAVLLLLLGIKRVFSGRKSSSKSTL